MFQNLQPLYLKNLEKLVPATDCKDKDLGIHKKSNQNSTKVTTYCSGSIFNE